MSTKKNFDLGKIIPKILTQRKKNNLKSSGYAWCPTCSFDETNDKRYFHRGKDCIENFCKDLKEIGREIIIDFEEKQMIPLTNKEIKSYEKHISKTKLCYEKEFKN